MASSAGPAVSTPSSMDGQDDDEAIIIVDADDDDSQAAAAQALGPHTGSAAELGPDQNPAGAPFGDDR